MICDECGPTVPGCSLSVAIFSAKTTFRDFGGLKFK